MRQATRAEPATPATKILSWALLAFSSIALWVLFFALVLSSLQFAHNQHNLYGQFRQQLAEEVAPLGGVIAPDSPVALLSVPSAGLHNVVIVEGTASSDLALGPGHRRDTPLPGQAGTIAIFGRARLFGGPFGRIATVKPGAMITMITAQGTFRYKVEQVRHVGDRFSPQLLDNQSRVVLGTSEGSGWRSGWAPSRPVYVDALLQGKTVASPDVIPASIPTAEAVMQGDTGALYSLVLWLGLLVLVSVAVVWLAQRWGRWQTWLLGTPVLLAALWGSTETAVRLLPNLM